MSNKQDDDQYTDDFSDDSYETQEENLDGNENPGEWDDDGYVGDDEAAQNDGAADNNATQKKKKSSLSTIIIIAVAIIGCLGFLLFKFGSGTTPPSTSAEQADTGETLAPTDGTASGDVASGDPTTPTATNPATPATENNSTDVVDATPDAQGFMMAPEKVENVVIKEPEPPPIETPPKELDAAPSANGQGAENPATPDLTTATTSPAEFPTVANILKPQPDTKETPADMTAIAAEAADKLPETLPVVETPPEIAPPNNMTGGEMTTAPQSLDVKGSKEYQDLSKNLDLANQKIAELEQKIAAQDKPESVETTNNSAEIASLQEKIAELQEKLQVQSSRTSEQAPRVTRSIVKKQAANKTVATHYQTPSRWILRSASTGKAILYNQSTNESKSVRIGDTVSTIGSITSIEKLSGKWVVKGTAGQISR